MGRLVKVGLLQAPSERTGVPDGVDSHGNPTYRWDNANWVIRKTQRIPLQPGYGFGFVMQIPPISAGDAITTTIRVTLPNGSVFGKRSEPEVIERTVRYESNESGKLRTECWLFDEKHPEHFLLGTWTIELINDGKVRFSPKFLAVSTLDYMSGGVTSTVQRVTDKSGPEKPLP